MLDLCFASVLAWTSPPALPPLPGEAAATPTGETAQPEAPAPVQSVTAQPSPAQPDPAAPPATAPETAVPTPGSSPTAPPQPAEVAGPPAAAPEDPAPSPVVVAPRAVHDIELAEAPSRRVDIPPPAYRGRGMLITAGILGLTGMGIKLWGSATAQGDPAMLAFTGLFHNPIMGTAIGLLGGGMAMVGRSDAHDELFEGTPSTRRRRTVLGWSLFGAGAGLWAVTRVAGPLLCSTEECFVRVWEAGYYVSLAATAPGIAMGAYGSAYEGYERRFGHLARRMSVAPMASRNAWGLSLSGRF
ncbi:MAG: hypothetical protein AB1Z98_34925 [Nannocystaceae bacterium]